MYMYSYLRLYVCLYTHILNREDIDWEGIFSMHVSGKDLCQGNIKNSHR